MNVRGHTIFLVANNSLVLATRLTNNVPMIYWVNYNNNWTESKNLKNKISCYNDWFSRQSSENASLMIIKYTTEYEESYLNLTNELYLIAFKSWFSLTMSTWLKRFIEYIVSSMEIF